MTALEAPSITPCPVSWCPEAGRHMWLVAPSGDSCRFHEVRSQISAEGVCTDKLTVTVTVAAEVFEDSETDELDRSVQVILDDVMDAVVLLRSRETVDELVFALQDAADLVFPEPPVEPCVTPEDEAEFDAATAELVERAGKPTDVNRLVAAAVRFRNAYLGAEGDR